MSVWICVHKIKLHSIDFYPKFKALDLFKTPTLKINFSKKHDFKEHLN